MIKVFSFFPEEQLDIKLIDNRRFLFLGKLGSPELKNFGIVFELETEEVYIYNQFYYELGMKPSPVSFVNRSLLIFLIFATKIHQLMNEIEQKENDRENRTTNKQKFRNSLVLLQKELSEIDELALLDSNNFWREPLLEIDLILDGYDE